MGAVWPLLPGSSIWECPAYYMLWSVCNICFWFWIFQLNWLHQVWSYFWLAMGLTYNHLWKVVLFHSNLLHHWAWQVESSLYCQSTQCMMLASMYCQGFISGCYEFCSLPYMFLLNMCVSGVVQAVPQFCFCCFSLCSLRLGFLFFLFADFLSDVKLYNLIIWFLSILSRFI
jgi:hypothetical protein